MGEGDLIPCRHHSFNHSSLVGHDNKEIMQVRVRVANKYGRITYLEGGRTEIGSCYGQAQQIQVAMVPSGFMAAPSIFSDEFIVVPLGVGHKMCV